MKKTVFNQFDEGLIEEGLQGFNKQIVNSCKQSYPNCSL